MRGVAVTEASGDGELLEENVHGAALALQKLGRLDESMAMGQREYELTQKCGHPEHLARAMWLISELDDAMGKSRAGLQMLEKALVVNQTSNDRDGTLILLDNLALRYGEIGDYDSAIHMENEVLALQPTGSVGKAIAYNNIGEMLAYRSGHIDEAWKWYEKAVTASTAPDAWRVHLGALPECRRYAESARERLPNPMMRLTAGAGDCADVEGCGSGEHWIAHAVRCVAAERRNSARYRY